MSYQHVSTVYKTIIKLVNQPLLGLFVKVDHHVSAKYGMEDVLEWKRLYEIKMLEYNHVS